MATTANPRETLDLAIKEHAFQQLVTNAARMYGWLPYHTFRSDRSQPGYPDLTLVRERCIWAELKTMRGRLRPEQKVWIEALKAAGQEVYVWKPCDWDDIVRLLSGREEV